MFRALLVFSALTLSGHAPILPPALGPFTVNGGGITDRNGAPVLLRGVEGELGAFQTPALGVLRLRWNLNAVRLQAAESSAGLDALLREAESLGMAVIVETSSEPLRQRLSSVPNVLLADRIVTTRIDSSVAAECGKAPEKVNDAVLERLLAASSQHVTISGFRAGGLVKDLLEFAPTAFTAQMACGETEMQGIGEMVLLFTTGDTTGFGYLSPDRVASKAGGPASPLVPGQLISIYTENLGPETGVEASPGPLPLALGNTRVEIGGVSAPLLAARAFQIDALVPTALPPGPRTAMRVVYRGVQSNLASMEVVRAAPEIFVDPFSRLAIAANQNGTRNGPGAPAPPGSVVTIYATGCGAAVEAPAATLIEPVEVTVGGMPAAVEFAGKAPGFAGLDQINVRLPGGTPAEERTVEIRLTVAGRTNRSPAFLRLR